MQDRLHLEIQEARVRISDLRRRAGPTQGEPILGAALEELTSTIHELQTVADELRQQNEILIATRTTVEEERRRYEELFEFAPDGYLVTDLEGQIVEANRAAGLLFRVAPGYLAGKPLAGYVDPSARLAFSDLLFAIRGAARSAGSSS